MHPNPIFRGEDDIRNLGFARERGFGVLAVPHEEMPLLAHVPFLIDAEGASLEVHLLRSNPIARLLHKEGPKIAKIAVSGPDSYISPDWYGVEDQVPTWNYVAVHLSGVLEPLPQEDLPGLLDRLSADFEARLLPKAPWRRDKMTPDVFEKMLRMIQPFRMRIERIDGTWKLGQNKPSEVRGAAAAVVAGYGIGQEVALLAALMQGVDRGVDKPREDT